jgi:hydroxylamine reductase (hybrid-cluster protein)
LFVSGKYWTILNQEVKVMISEAVRTVKRVSQSPLQNGNKKYIDSIFEKGDYTHNYPEENIVGEYYDVSQRRSTCKESLHAVVARNFVQMCTIGASAHTDHARNMAFTLLAAARGEIRDFIIRDKEKLLQTADLLGIYSIGSKEDIAEKVALKLLEQFGQQEGKVAYCSRAPQKRQNIWKELDIYPQGIDHEIVKTLHLTSMGNNENPQNLLAAAAKVAITDGWGASMIATDISDIFCRISQPLLGKDDLHLFEEDRADFFDYGYEPEDTEKKCSEEFFSFYKSFIHNSTFKHVIDALRKGQIRGIVGLASCHDTGVTQNTIHNFLAKELIRENILVIQTECSPAASAQSKIMAAETNSFAGSDLSAICKTLNIPPVLPFGHCNDNSRILTIASQICQEMEKSDIGGLPFVSIIPESMCVKAFASGMYFVASGIPVIFSGEVSPVSVSSVVQDIMENTFWDMLNAGFYFESHPQNILDMTIGLINNLRKSSGMNK